jgi:outer membrane protein assembly factor BamB
VLEAATGAEIWCSEHDGEVNAVVFSPDGRWVATASGGFRDAGSARLLNATTGAEIWRADQHATVNAVVFSTNGKRVATAAGATGGGSARVIDTATGADIWRVDLDSSVSAVVFSPDGTLVAAAGGDGRAGGRVWLHDAETGALIWHAETPVRCAGSTSARTEAGSPPLSAVAGPLVAVLAFLIRKMDGRSACGVPECVLNARRGRCRTGP